MKHLIKTMAFTLLGLVLSINLMADVAPVNTVLWGEDFSSFLNSGTLTENPSKSGASTTVYGNTTLDYTYTVSGTKLYKGSMSAGGSEPEILIKGGGTFTASKIPTGSAKKISLSFGSNKEAWSVTCSSDAYTVSGSKKSFVLTLGAGKTAPANINITIKNTTTSTNQRIDDIVLKVTEAGASKTPLTTPSGLTVGTTTSTSANVSWTAGDATNTGSYKVEYKTSSASTWTAVSPNPTTTSCTITGLAPSTTYNWRVTAIPSASAAATKDNSSAANGDNFTTAAPASHDIFWYANGQQVAKNNQQEGATLTIPADPNPSTYCDGKTFVGWTAASIVATDGTGITYVKAGDKVNSTDKYYAVFADVEGMTGYKKVTTPTVGNTYIFVSSASAGSAFALDAKQMATSAGSSSPAKGVTITSSGLDIIVSTIDTDLEFKYVEKDSKKDFDIVCSTTGEKLVINGSGIGKVTSNYKSFWDDNNGLYGTNSKGTTNYYVKYNSDNSVKAFQATTATTARVYAYEKQEGTYSDYTTTCAPTYEATVADGILNGSVLISKTDDATAGAASLTGLHEGDIVYIFPTANTGYNIESVSVNETPISDQSDKYSYTIGKAGITVSATFTAATYNISYNLDGGAWNGTAGVATYTYGTGVPTLPTNVEKANNTFLGWYVTNPAEIVTFIGTTETGDKSFIASWLPSGARDVTYSGGDQLNYISNPQIVDKEDPSLTVTYSVNKGYTISAVAVTVNDAALTESEVVFNDEQLIITPTAGFTGNVSITFTVVEKMFTVTWMANKTQFKQEQIKEGSKVTLPAETPSDVDGDDGTYKFQGWTVDEQYSNETTAPAYITNNTIEPTGDVTYYAVYAIVEKTPSTTTYTRVTEESQLQTASSLVIVNNSASKLFTNALGTATAPTESNGEITVNNTDMWSLSYANSKYTISNASGTLGAATMPAKSSGNYNKPMSITSSNNSWTIAESGTDLFVLKNANNVGIEYYSSNWVVYINDNIADVAACAHKLYIPKMINTIKNYRTRVAIIDHIAVNGTPVETKFVAGETFDATGLSIDVYYQGEDNPTNVTTGFTYAPTGALKTTDENITFTYQGKTADVAISVSNTVSKIEVTTDPTKMEYTEGEQFNPEGMVVTATYDNDAKRVVTGYDYEPKGDLALGDKITISFGGQTTELGITINEATKTTVNWFVEGAPYTAGNPSIAVIPGKKITVLPTEPDACQGNQFVGWTTQETYYNATTAPDDLFKTLAEAPTIGSETTNFYAVFAQITSTPVAESTVYTSNIDNDKLGDKVNIGGSDDNQVVAKKLGTSNTPASSLSFTVPAGTTTITLHAVAWKDKSNVTITMSTEKAGVVITPSDAQAVSANNGATGNSPFSITPADGDFYTFTLSGVTEETEVTISNATERVVLWGINTATTITSDYSTTCLAALANPTITTAEGTYCGSVDVEITQPAGNPDGAKIMYSTDNETWNEYTAAVNITTSGTVYAKVVKDPKQTEVVSATYTVYPAYTLAQAATAASATSQIACLTFTDLLVQARSLNEAFLKASDGQIVLLNKSSHGLQVGDKLSASDAHVTFVKAHDLLQLTSTKGIAAATTGNATTPEEKTITALVATDYGQLVKIMDVTYDAANKKFTDASSNEIAVDAKFFPSGIPTSWPDGGKFNVTGIVLTDGESVVIAPRNGEDLESLATPLDAPTNFAVASVNSYQASYSWTAVENNAGYTLYIYDGETEIYKSTTIGKTRTDYAPTKVLEAGHTYTAKLVALGDKVEHSDSPAAETTFTTNPNAKLNWYVGGEFYTSTDASQEKVVTPEDPESPCATNYENFVTWYTEEFDGQITALDAAKKVKAGDAAASQVGSAKEYNFYAVFGKIKTAGTDKYVKVTEAQDDWKGEYLIGYDEENDEATSIKVFDGNLTTLDATNNYQTVSFETDGSIAANETNNSYRFNIEKSTTEGDYYIQSARGYYIANTTSDNKLSQDNAKGLDNIIEWNSDEQRVVIKSDANETYYTFLSFNSTSGQTRFRYMKSDYKNLVLYKRTKTNPTYNGYITTCPQTYTITIAENTKGLVEAATTTEILKGAKVLLTATANAGYTKTGGAWVVKKTATSEVVEGLVGNTNYLTMPDYNVTIDYDFQEIKDQFVDNLHGNTTIEKGGANYELPTLEDAEPGEKCDAYYVFAGWVAAEHTADSGEPAEDDSHVLNGKQTATGATYYALWWNVGDYFITECCTTPIPEKRDDLTKVQATSAQIGWYKVDGADKYHVTLVKDGDTKGEGEDLVITDGQYKYVMNGLTVNTSYTVYVKAHISCWGEEQVWNFTTAEEKNSYKVTINAEGGTYTIDPVLVDGKITEGETVTITDIIPNDADRYFFKELTVPEATDLIEIEGGYMFTMPSKAITINIVFAEYPTVTWKMEGAADVVTTAVLYEDKFVVGTVQPAPANWKYKTYFPEFAGWVTSDKCDANGNVTTAEFITATTEVPTDGLTVYGAVAKSSAPDCSTATKITSNENLDMSALYVIGAEYSEKTLFYNSIDGTWGKTTQEVSGKTPIIFTISGTKDAIALLGSDGNYIKGCTTKSFAISTDKQEVMIAEGGNIIFGTTTWYLQYNYNSGAGGLRWYSSTSYPFAYLYKVALAYEKLTIDPQPDYARTDLVVGNYGTVCVPYAVKTTDRSGATFWNIETSNTPGYTNPTSVTIVEETGNLVAGKPYIFCATETEMAMFFSGDKYEGTESVLANGLFGNLTDGTITINPTGSEYQSGIFFVLQQKLYECGWNCTVGPNRGWVQAADIQNMTTPSPAPRRVIGNPNGTPTGINNLNTDGFKNIEGARKYFHNNNIVIVNEGRIYNAQGIKIQ